MKAQDRIIGAATISSSILLLVGSLVFFADDAQAGRRHHRAVPNPSPAPQSEASSKNDVGEIREASVSTPSAAAVPIPSSLTRMGDVAGKPDGSVGAPSPSVVSGRAAPPPGIEVSFKVDARLTKGLFAGESWVSPPVSLHGDAQAGTAPTFEARVEALDTKGQTVDSGLEWTAADTEMVTVSPSQGNEVRITVRHAGQSSLRVGSQKASRQLSIMSWYQDGALQVEISEKR